jgi:hypothetical protein
MDARLYRRTLFVFGGCAFLVGLAVGKIQSGTETALTFITLALAALGVAFCAYALAKKPDA